MIKKFDEIKELRFFYFPTPCCCWVQASTGTKVRIEVVPCLKS